MFRSRDIKKKITYMKYHIILLAFISYEAKSSVAPGIYYVEVLDDAVLVEQFGLEQQVSINPEPVCTSQQFTKVKVMKDWEGNFVITIQLDAAGTVEFERVTSQWIGKQLAIVIDGEIQMAPVVQGIISNGFLQISNRYYDKKTCKRLARMIKQ